jgi:hypothetical protein
MAWSTQELLKIGNELVRAIVRYLIIGIVGIVIIGFAASGIRISTVKRAINQAEVLLQANRPGEALDQVARLEPWAMPYPNLYRGLVCTAVKCHVRLSDIASARKAAEDLVDRQCRSFNISIAPRYLVRTLRDSLINKFLSNLGAEGSLTEWSGYQALVSELRAAGGYEEIIKELEIKMPASAWPVASAQASSGAPSFKEKPAGPSGVGSGAVTQADEEMKKTLKARQAQLAEEIEKISNEHAADGNKENPYAAEYSAAKAAHKEFWAKVKKLTAKRDAAKGEERLKYIDELHKLKGQDLKVAEARDTAKKKYKDWENANSADPAKNQRLADLESELADVQDKLYKIEDAQ